MKKGMLVVLILGTFFDQTAIAMTSSSYLAYLKQLANRAWRPVARQYAAWFPTPQAQSVTLSSRPYSTLPRFSSPYGTTNIGQFTRQQFATNAPTTALFPQPQFANLNLRKFSGSTPTGIWKKWLYGEQGTPAETIATEPVVVATPSSRQLTSSEIKAQVRLQELKQPTMLPIYIQLREMADQIDSQSDRAAIKTAIRELIDKDPELQENIIRDITKEEKPYDRILTILVTIDNIDKVSDGFNLLSEDTRKKIKNTLINYLKNRSILTNMDFVRFALCSRELGTIPVQSTVLNFQRDDGVMSSPSERRLFNLIDIIQTDAIKALEIHISSAVPIVNNIIKAHYNLDNQETVEKAVKEILTEHHISIDAINALLNNQPIPSYGGELTPEEEQAGKDYVRKRLEKS